MWNAWSRRDVAEVPHVVGEGGVVEREGHPPPSTAGSSAPNRGREQGRGEQSWRQPYLSKEEGEDGPRKGCLSAPGLGRGWSVGGCPP